MDPHAAVPRIRTGLLLPVEHVPALPADSGCLRSPSSSSCCVLLAGNLHEPGFPRAQRLQQQNQPASGPQPRGPPIRPWPGLPSPHRGEVPPLSPPRPAEGLPQGYLNLCIPRAGVGNLAWGSSGLDPPSLNTPCSAPMYPTGQYPLISLLPKAPLAEVPCMSLGSHPGRQLGPLRPRVPH